MKRPNWRKAFGVGLLLMYPLRLNYGLVVLWSYLSVFAYSQGNYNFTPFKLNKINKNYPLFGCLSKTCSLSFIDRIMWTKKRSNYLRETVLTQMYPPHVTCDACGGLLKWLKIDKKYAFSHQRPREITSDWGVSALQLYQKATITKL